MDYKKIIILFITFVSIVFTMLVFNNCSGANLTSQSAGALQSTDSHTSNGASTSSCASGGQTYVVGSTISGYVMSSALFPVQCGAQVNRTCQTGGQFNGSVPLFASCQQFCVHPLTGAQVPSGQTVSVYSQAAGASSTECSSALVNLTCQASTGTFSSSQPSVSNYFSSCALPGQTCSYPAAGVGVVQPLSTSLNSSVTGFKLASATYPNLCSSQVTSVCQSSGAWSQGSPLYSSCSQFCLHPDTNMPMSSGSTYSYYTISSGAQAQCAAALVTASCVASTGKLSSAISATRFTSCAVTSSPLSTSTNFLDTIFVSGHPWTQDISAVALDAQSDALITALNSKGGWGTGTTMQITFDFHILMADSKTPTFNVVDLPAEPHYAPDCDINFLFPLPSGGAIEGENAYSCTSGGDCHLTIVDQANGILYESYRSQLSGTSLQSTCAVKWDLKKAYDPKLRGEQCTSTDAAGLPITPLLFTADEIASGAINHAIRFILPNNRIRNAYVRPATHGTNAASAGVNGIPYGARLRLKSSFDITRYSVGAQVILKAMKKYGIILADGGNIPLTASTDRFTTKKWSDVGISSQALTNVKVTDFEIVDLGTRIQVTNNCVRSN